MIDDLNNFTITLITTIVMIIIIKMMLPEGKNKKYILFVCGMIITFVLIEPVLKLMDINLEEIFAQNNNLYDEYKRSDELYQKTIKNTYEQTLINDITVRLKENGYKVSNVRIEYDELSFEPKKLFMNLENADGYIQPVKIEVSNNAVVDRINDLTSSKIKEIVQANYGIDKNNIYIERSE